MASSTAVIAPSMRRGRQSRPYLIEKAFQLSIAQNMCLADCIESMTTHQSPSFCITRWCRINTGDGLPPHVGAQGGGPLRGLSHLEERTGGPNTQESSRRTSRRRGSSPGCWLGWPPSWEHHVWSSKTLCRAKRKGKAKEATSHPQLAS